MKFFCLFHFLLLLFTPFILRAQELSTEGDFESANKDYKPFFHSNLREAERGDAKAMGILGLMYEKGLGCEKNLAEALDWLKKGARKGDADAENNLGFHVLPGYGSEGGRRPKL